MLRSVVNLQHIRTFGSSAAVATLLGSIACGTPIAKVVSAAPPAVSRADVAANKPEPVLSTLPEKVHVAPNSGMVAPESSGLIVPPAPPDPPAPVATGAPPTAAPARVPPWEITCLAKYYAAKPGRYVGQWTLRTAAGAHAYYTQVRTPEGNQVGVRDMFVPAYLRGPIGPVLDIASDAGTVRSTVLFEATYGKDTVEIHSRLRLIDFFGTQLRIHELVRPALVRVIAKLTAAKAQTPGLQVYLEHLGGTYNHRMIAGTQTLSPHAFGIAIDLSTWHANYWRTDPIEPGATRAAWKNLIPDAIVQAFESEGFIWGGRWYHFDTMHFEYRPELLDPTCVPPLAAPPAAPPAVAP
jgi:hypothetical protein